MTRRLTISLALAVLAVPAVGGTPAVGNGNDSNIYLARAFLSPYQPYFHGRVGSVRLKCERHRTVQVQRFSNRKVVGTTMTNRFGRWKLPRPGIYGRFFARVRYKRVIRPGLVCAPSSSRSHVIRVQRGGKQ
jgi:hypothetical protein